MSCWYRIKILSSKADFLVIYRLRPLVSDGQVNVLGGERSADGHRGS